MFYVEIDGLFCYFVRNIDCLSFTIYFDFYLPVLHTSQFLPTFVFSFPMSSAEVLVPLDPKKSTPIKSTSRTNKRKFVERKDLDEDEVAAVAVSDMNSPDYLDYPIYAKSKHCSCTQPESKKVLEEKLQYYAQLPNLWTFIDDMDNTNQMFKDGVMPCGPCLRILASLIHSYDKKQDEDVPETLDNLSWFYTLMNWWQWTPDQQKWARVILHIHRATIGFQESDYQTRESYETIIHETIFAPRFGIVMGSKGNSINAVATALLVYQCLLEADPSTMKKLKFEHGDATKTKIPTTKQKEENKEKEKGEDDDEDDQAEQNEDEEEDEEDEESDYEEGDSDGDTNEMEKIKREVPVLLKDVENNTM